MIIYVASGHQIEQDIILEKFTTKRISRGIHELEFDIIPPDRSKIDKKDLLN